MIAPRQLAISFPATAATISPARRRVRRTLETSRPDAFSGRGFDEPEIDQHLIHMRMRSAWRPRSPRTRTGIELGIMSNDSNIGHSRDAVQEVLDHELRACLSFGVVAGDDRGRDVQPRPAPLGCGAARVDVAEEADTAAPDGFNVLRVAGIIAESRPQIENVIADEIRRHIYVTPELRKKFRVRDKLALAPQQAGEKRRRFRAEPDLPILAGQPLIVFVIGPAIRQT